MRRNHRLGRDWSRFICPKCKCVLISCSDSLTLSCENCSEFIAILKCSGANCKFRKKMCMTCDCDSFEQLEKNTQQQAIDKFTTCQIKNIKRNCCKIILVFVVLFICYILRKVLSESYEDSNVALLKSLKADYPSQKNETWYHVLSVLEKEIPCVKSITFLHGEDKSTSNCLKNKLVSLYTANPNINMEEISVSTVGPEGRDYGFYLEHYHAVIQRFRVLVADLTKVPGNIARIFHSLCDEVSSNIKPSLCIFTLKYDEKMENQKPIQRAGNILKKAWSNLPQSEISPLLSRILKNVVDIVPEGQVNC